MSNRQAFRRRRVISVIPWRDMLIAVCNDGTIYEGRAMMNTPDDPRRIREQVCWTPAPTNIPLEQRRQ